MTTVVAADAYLLQAIDLQPLGPFHIGARGVGIERTDEAVRSDALHSAICSLVAATEGRAAVEQLLDELASERPPWRLSSLFPRAGDVRFYPRPYITFITFPFSEGAAREFKGMRFVSEGVLARVLTGADLEPLLSTANLRAGGELLLTPEELGGLPELGVAAAPERFWVRRTTPHVALDRISGRSNLYGSGDVHFAAGCGYRLLMQTRDEAAGARLLGLLERLGDEGLAGRRSSGHGHFRIEGTRPSGLPLVESTDYFLTLSLYHPTRDELAGGLLDGEAAYALVERAGWVASAERAGQRWRSLRMFAEGSVLHGDASRIRGDVSDVTPPGDGHRVYRVGIPLALPMRLPSRPAAAVTERQPRQAQPDEPVRGAAQAVKRAPATRVRRVRRGVIGLPGRKGKKR